MATDPTSVPGRLSAEGARHEAERSTGAITPAGREVTAAAKRAAGVAEWDTSVSRFGRDLLQDLPADLQRECRAPGLSEADVWKAIDNSGVKLTTRQRAMRDAFELGITDQLVRNWA